MDSFNSLLYTVRDRTFGKMEYKHGWLKTQEVNLHGKNWNLKIRAAAYTGEKICEEQRSGYRYFNDNIQRISEVCSEEIVKYVKEHTADIVGILPAIKDIDESTVSCFVTPSTVLFDRDGSVVLLYDAKWDEDNGIGIEVHPKVKIGLQDEFL